MSSSDPSRAAAVSRIVSQAARIAAWVAEGKPITDTRVPRRSDLPAVAQALGVEIPARVRSTADVKGIHYPWTVAVASGMITMRAARAVAVPDFRRDPMEVWLLGLEGVLRAESTNRRFQEALFVGSAVLTVLADGRRLRDRRTFEDPVRELLEPFRGEAGWDYLSWVESQEVALGVLAEFGAVDQRQRLTPLGRWAQGHMKTHLPIQIAPDMDARELLKLLTGLSDDQAWRRAGPWLASRSGVDAATQLLRAAEGASASERMAAVVMVCDLGDDALPAWNEALQMPDLALHAQVVLAGGKPRLNEAQSGWLTTEYGLAELERSGAEEAYWCVQESGGLEAVRLGGHPNAAALLDALASLVASGGGRVRIYQLKIGLGGSQPTVWRRVLVPASATLDLLHEIIQIVMGWSGDHLHAFTVDGTRYSNHSYGLEGCDDEDAVRLARALPRRGATVEYQYDFGASWYHVITLEAILDPVGTTVYPICVDGSGDPPIEYEGWDDALLDEEDEEDEDEEDEEDEDSLEDWDDELPEEEEERHFDRDGINLRLAMLMAEEEEEEEEPEGTGLG